MDETPPMENNSDTDYDILSLSSRCVSSDDNDLRNSWCGIEDQADEDTDDEPHHQGTESAPSLPQALKMPTLAFSDCMSESTPTPSKYFLKDDLKLEWDSVSQITKKPSQTTHHLPVLGAPVDKVCLLNLSSEPAPTVVLDLFVQYYGIKTQVEMVPMTHFDNLEFHSTTAYVGFIFFSAEETISSALVKVDAALEAQFRGVYVTVWSPTQLNKCSLINKAVFTALTPLQESSLLNFPLAVDSFDPLDIQLIEWEEHRLRRKRLSLWSFQVNQATVWKAIVGFLILAISAQMSQYFLVYNAEQVNVAPPSPEVVPVLSSATILTKATDKPVRKLTTKKCRSEPYDSTSVIIIPPAPSSKVDRVRSQYNLLKKKYSQSSEQSKRSEKFTEFELSSEQPQSEPPLPEKQHFEKPQAEKPQVGLNEFIWKAIKRAQRHKLVKGTRSHGLEIFHRLEKAELPQKANKLVAQYVSAQRSLQTSVKTIFQDQIVMLKAKSTKVPLMAGELKRKYDEWLDGDGRKLWLSFQANCEDYIRLAKQHSLVVNSKSLWNNTRQQTNRFAAELNRHIRRFITETRNSSPNWRLKIDRLITKAKRQSFFCKLKRTKQPRTKCSSSKCSYYRDWYSCSKNKCHQQEKKDRLPWSWVSHRWTLGWSR